MPSVFTKIINGELPGYLIWQDELVVAFLALDQIQPGHVLVVPREEAETFLDLSEPSYTRLFQVAQKVGRAVAELTHCQRVGLAAQGFEVHHCHIHLIPLSSPRDFDFALARRLPAEQMSSLQKALREWLHKNPSEGS